MATINLTAQETRDIIKAGVRAVYGVKYEGYSVWRTGSDASVLRLSLKPHTEEDDQGFQIILDKTKEEPLAATNGRAMEATNGVKADAT